MERLQVAQNAVGCTSSRTTDNCSSYTIAMTSVATTEKELFGGAITAVLQSDLIDASYVPKTQDLLSLQRNRSSLKAIFDITPVDVLSDLQREG